MEEQASEELNYQLNSTMKTIEGIDENQSSFLGQLDLSKMNPNEDRSHFENSSFENQISLHQLRVSEASTMKIGNQTDSLDKSFSDKLDNSEFGPKANASFFNNRSGEHYIVPIGFLADKYSNLLNQIRFSTLTETKKELEVILTKWNTLALDLNELIDNFLVIRVINPGAEKKRVLKLALEKDLLEKGIDNLKKVISKLDSCSDISMKEIINQVYNDFFHDKICELEKKDPVHQITSLVFRREYLKDNIKSYENATKARDLIVRKARSIYSLSHKDTKMVDYLGVAPIKMSNQLSLERLRLPFLNDEINKFDPLKSIH